MPFAVVIAPICVASGFVGGYGIAATLLWGRLLYHVPLSIDHPFAFAVALPACMLAIGMLGLVMASTFVLYRAAFSLGSPLQYPVWIATGLLVPLSTLPAFVHEIGWFLGPYWGFRAIHEAVFGVVAVAVHRHVRGRQHRLPRPRRRVPARIRAGRARPRDAEADVNSLACSSSAA